jgi:hypothetical protein
MICLVATGVSDHGQLVWRKRLDIAMLSDRAKNANGEAMDS